MDMDEENSDFERYDSDESELEDVDLEDSVPDPQSFETLTTDEIMKLMSQNIEHVNAIVQVCNANVYKATNVIQCKNMYVI